MELGPRIVERLEYLGISQSELARQVGVAQSTINNIITKHRRSTPHLIAISRALRTSPEYLTGDSDIPDSARVVVTQPAMVDEDDDTVEVAALDVSYGMGGTFIEEHLVNVEKVKFSRSWLRQYTDAPPELLFVANGIGDSMWPTIHDTDGVVVDRSDRVPRMVDKIWAMSFGEIGMIKRLRPRPDGTMTILSDNPQVPDDRATDGELNVIGRVVAIVRKV